MSTYQDVTFYAQVEPDWTRYVGAELELTGARVARITRRQPERPRDGALVVKLTLRIPVDRLLPLAPEVIVLDSADTEVGVTAEELLQ